MKIFITLVGVFATSLTFAAVAPRSPEQLEKGATLICKGVVENIKVTIKGTPVNSRWVVELTARVESVLKSTGEGPEEGSTIQIQTWASRRMSHPGPQGQDLVPGLNSEFKVYLQKASDGNGWEPLEPNGFELLSGDRIDYQLFENQRSSRLTAVILAGLAVAGCIIFVIRQNRRGNA